MSTQWLRRVLVVCVAATGLVVPAASALAAPSEPTVSLTGCTGTVTITKAGGSAGGTLNVPTTAEASKSRPVVVAWDDTVAYGGQTTTAITDNRWTAHLDGFPVASGGGADNTASGEVKIKKFFPMKLTGLYYVDYRLTGTGGECAGHAWVKLDGNPLATIPFWIGIVVILGSLYLIWNSRPRRRPDGEVRRGWIGGFFAGILLGLGVLIATITGGVAAFTTWYPYVLALIVAVLLGLLVALFGPTTGSAAVADDTQRMRTVRPTEPTPVEPASTNDALIGGAVAGAVLAESAADDREPPAVEPAADPAVDPAPESSAGDAAEVGTAAGAAAAGVAAEESAAGDGAEDTAAGESTSVGTAAGAAAAGVAAEEAATGEAGGAGTADDAAAVGVAADEAPTEESAADGAEPAGDAAAMSAGTADTSADGADSEAEDDSPADEPTLVDEPVAEEPTLVDQPPVTSAPDDAAATGDTYDDPGPAADSSDAGTQADGPADAGSPDTGAWDTGSSGYGSSDSGPSSSDSSSGASDGGSSTSH